MNKQLTASITFSVELTMEMTRASPSILKLEQDISHVLESLGGEVTLSASRLLALDGLKGIGISTRNLSSSIYYGDSLLTRV
jgi:hypothetical protein